MNALTRVRSRARGRASTALCVCLSLLAACDQSEQRGQSGQGPRRAGPVVARVNGEAIALEEVRELCRAAQLTPEQALRRLVAERLLAQYAEQRGYGDLPSTQLELERARVRALLESVAGTAASGPEATQQVEGLVRELRQATRVEYDEQKLHKALAEDGVLGSGT